MSYRYYSTQRPVGIGTFPKPTDGGRVLEVVNYGEKRFVPALQGEAWGYIDYEKPLLVKEAERYELKAVYDYRFMFRLGDAEEPQFLNMPAPNIGAAWEAAFNWATKHDLISELLVMEWVSVEQRAF